VLLIVIPVGTKQGSELQTNECAWQKDFRNLNENCFREGTVISIRYTYFPIKLHSNFNCGRLEPNKGGVPNMESSVGMKGHTCQVHPWMGMDLIDLRALHILHAHIFFLMAKLKFQLYVTQKCIDY